MDDHRLSLAGLDGSNPLAFLAALGTLRASTQFEPSVRLGWAMSRGGWRPFLAMVGVYDAESLVDALVNSLANRESRPEFDLGSDQDNLSVAPSLYREFAQRSAELASARDRTTADFAAAFGTDALSDSSGERIQDTALRTMSGAGHQHFLGTMRTVIKETARAHLRRALFERWRYDDPLRGRSLRWEPTEDRRHAYQWIDPSKDPLRGRAGSMLGANRLAIEALPLISTSPVGAASGRGQARLGTTGFRTRKGRTEWTWPLWAPPLGVDVIRSVLALRELQEAERYSESLRARGIVGILRTTRLNVEYYRNFTPAVAV